MAGVPHRRLTIRDYTPSDVSMWRTYYSKTDAVAHVVPGFEGRAHILGLFCWCHPIYDKDYAYDGDVITHNVAQ